MKKFFIFLIISIMLLTLPSSAENTTFEKELYLKRYYLEMIARYPQFRNVPESDFDEEIYLNKEKNSISIRFTYSPSGLRSWCYCRFKKNSENPEGEWLFSEENEDFSRNYARKIPKTVSRSIRVHLNNMMDEYIDEHHLTTKRGRAMSLLYKNGQLFAHCEQIAECTQEEYGRDHIHVFAIIDIDFVNGTIKLSPRPIIVPNW